MRKSKNWFDDHSGSAKRLSLGAGATTGGRFLAGEPLGGGRPQIEIGLAETRLQFDGALRIGQPIFRDMAEGFDDLGHLLGVAVGLAAFLARLEVSGERPAALLDQPRQIARELLDVDGADLHRFLRWSPHERFLDGCNGAKIAPLSRHGRRWSHPQGAFSVVSSASHGALRPGHHRRHATPSLRRGPCFDILPRYPQNLDDFSVGPYKPLRDQYFLVPPRPGTAPEQPKRKPFGANGAPRRGNIGDRTCTAVEA